MHAKTRWRNSYFCANGELRSQFPLLKYGAVVIYGDSDTVALTLLIKNFNCVVKKFYLTPCQIYNADELGMSWKKYEKYAPGHKTSKERLTIMTCCEASRDHKLKVTVIGQPKKKEIKKVFLVTIKTIQTLGWTNRFFRRRLKINFYLLYVTIWKRKITYSCFITQQFSFPTSWVELHNWKWTNFRTVSSTIRHITDPADGKRCNI